MKLVIISDTHGMHHRLAHPIPEGDVLIHCGDLTGHGSMAEVHSVARWMGAFPHKLKLAIAGNHDAACERRPDEARLEFNRCGVHYLQNRGLKFGGLHFYGAPWTPNFCDWHFMPERNSDELRHHWDKIPDETNVLITHGPPHGILDETGPEYRDYGAQEHAGCELLMERIKTGLPDLRLHCFGHIHEARGKYSLARENAHGVHFINAAINTRAYEPTNAPQVIEL